MGLPVSGPRSSAAVRLKVPLSFSRLFLGRASRVAHDWQTRETREPHVGSGAVRPMRGEDR